MKTSTLLHRFRILARVFRADPALLLRTPRYVLRSLKEGPRASLDRLRRVSHPLRFSSDYGAWRSEFGTTVEEKAAMAAWAQALSDPIQIAVVMPVFNPNPMWLQDAIDSVRQQIYPHWQLCIADDCSTDPRIRALLESAMSADSRIHVVFRGRNGHICASSNSALELVSAPWTALLDHDDLLADEALVWVAKAIAEHPQARLFYSDEDKLSFAGERVDPYFKCDWNPVLMEGQNMFCHLGVYNTELVRQVGGFREGFEGSQDHDLVLRCSRYLGREQIVHIPRVLYTWRVHSGSTASKISSKTYAIQAGIRAIDEHLRIQGIPLRQITWSASGYRAQLALPDLLPKVSVIIPTRNGLKVLRPCLASLLEKTSYSNIEVLVIDNGSDDPATLIYLLDLERLGKIQVLRDPSPFNYAALNNRAVQCATGEFICLLNNDIEVIEPSWLEELVLQALRPGAGAVGARLLYPNRTVQHGGVWLGIGGVAGHAHLRLDANSFGYFCRLQLAQEISAVTAACLLVRKRHYLAVGGLDKTNLKIAFNDVDFCLKLRELGLRNIYAPHAILVHHESVSRGYEDTPAKQVRFQAEVKYMKDRWANQLTCDPSYSPNLSLDDHLCGLARPPRLKRWADHVQK
jgi:glycosyltransferase involved in cell wall biosynthesis